MNKTHLTIAITVLLVITISLTYLLIPKQTSKVKTAGGFSKNILEPHKYTYVPEEEIEDDETESNKPTLDLAKLQGKDRLYTEEEGKYENLSEEEKKVLFFTYCYKDIAGRKARKWTCDAGESVVENARLVALKNGIAVLYSEGEGMPKGRLYIYDLSKQVLVAEIMDEGDIAFGPNYIIMEKISIQDSQVLQLLQLYRPGMSDFIDIPDSQSQEEYVDLSDQFNRVFPIEFGINSITTYLHTFKNCIDIGEDFAPGLYRCEVDTKVPKTFDISNLP